MEWQLLMLTEFLTEQSARLHSVNYMEILNNKITANELADILRISNKEVLRELYAQAYDVKLRHRGPNVYFRGLIEISNICKKNCLYCGIRAGNEKVIRYELLDSQIINEAHFALNAGYGSVVLQGGERCDKAFTNRITKLIKEIRLLRRNNFNKEANSNALGITLSLGEQSKEVYKEWYDAGAHRYLLRIEASNRELYQKIHPCDNTISSGANDARIKSIKDLKSIGYLTGTGVMIGLPFQTYIDLANDILFFKEMDIDMVGMGPYIPHSDTPLGKMYMSGIMVPGEVANLNNEERLELSIKMVAVLRCIMPTINIAATTALQVLAPDGRERALLAGANIIMPNVTDLSVKGNYNLYEGKPGVKDDAQTTKYELEKNLERLGIPIGWDMLGDVR